MFQQITGFVGHFYKSMCFHNKPEADKITCDDRVSSHIYSCSWFVLENAIIFGLEGI